MYEPYFQNNIDLNYCKWRDLKGEKKVYKDILFNMC